MEKKTVTVGLREAELVLGPNKFLLRHISCKCEPKKAGGSRELERASPERHLST